MKINLPTQIAVWKRQWSKSRVATGQEMVKEKFSSESGTLTFHCYRNDVFGSEGGGFLKPYDQYKRMAVRKFRRNYIVLAGVYLGTHELLW